MHQRQVDTIYPQKLEGNVIQEILSSKDHPKNRGIRDWPEKERPRERLIQQGVGVLSDAELLAILFRTGSQGKDAVTFSRDVLQRVGGLRSLLSLDTKELIKIHGLGQAKAASLLAASEIYRRQLRERIIGKKLIHDPDSVLDYLCSSMRDKKCEVMKVLFLDKGLCIIDEMDMFEGTVDATAVYPREIIKATLDRHATAIILVHNHPSGEIEPSSEDHEITQKIARACKDFSITLLDHIIIGTNNFFSFFEAGHLAEEVKTGGVSRDKL